MNSSFRFKVLAVACSALLAGGATAATITVVNNDGAGEGFNDPTIVAPLPSNPEVTLGAQRLRVVQAAANQWGALLQSSVEIRINVTFDPLTCDASGTVLGSAGAASAHADFANAPFAGHLYSAALANSLAGIDLAPATNDINSRYNSSVDTGCSATIPGWHYSTSSTDPTPAGRIALLPVVFHEFAHGLGFQTFANSTTGALNSGFPDSWTRNLMDAASGLRWNQMTNAQRQASAINDPNLVWAGPNVRVDKALFLAVAPKLVVNSPSAIAGAKDANPAAFGPAVPAGGLTGNLVLVDDATSTPPAGTPRDGCEALANAAAVAGNVALIERGSCNFTVKVKNAQLAGAIGAVVFNNVASGLPSMGGADATVAIPSYGIGQADGNAIIGQLGTAAVNATLGIDPLGTLAGTTRGFMRMNGPNPVQPGSSVSHWTVDASPNLLMEPSINPNLFNDVDLAIALFRDIGWNDNVSPGLYIFEGGFEEF